MGLLQLPSEPLSVNAFAAVPAKANAEVNSRLIESFENINFSLEKGD
jgi:hypothetical protein